MKFTVVALLSSVLAFNVQSQTFTPLLSLTVEQSYSTNPDESLVYITGKVRKLPSSQTGNNTNQPTLMTGNFSVLGAQSNFDASGLLLAADVEVRFWQPDQPGIFFKAQTDQNGDYVIGLGEGQWMGEACGSASQFYPAAWQLSIAGEALQSMQAVPQKVIELSATNTQYPAGAEVTLNGRGFGCNGRLVFQYSNPVDRCGIGQDVEYDHELIVVDDFIARSDTQIRFIMPQLAADRSVGKHIARIYYQQGNVRSPAIVMGESVSPLQLSSPLCQSTVTADVPEITVVSDSNGAPLMTIEVQTTPDSAQNTAANDLQGQIVSSDIGSETIVNQGIKRGFKIKPRVLPAYIGGG